MAFGSHMENGQIADFDRAPQSTRTTATETASVASGGSATMAEIRYVPAAWPRIRKPTSMASPPRVVTTRAWRAERRLCRCSLPWPISR